jgi:hypothetical protein
MNVFFQVYLMSTIGLAILAGFLILAYHILQGREEE